VTCDFVLTSQCDGVASPCHQITIRMLYSGTLYTVHLRGEQAKVSYPAHSR